MKKPILLGTALVASLGLIGGTFAAFMVSDKADPFGVRITPSVLAVDTSKKVTLEWGQKGLADIENLKGGETRGDYAIGLKASQTGLSEQEIEAGYTGQFVLSLTDLTQREASYEGAKLSDYLTIKVYDQPSTVANREAVYTGPGTRNVNVEYGTEKTFYITISMAHVEKEVMDVIKNDTLYMQVDWNKAEGDQDAAAATTIYASFPTGAIEQKFHVFNNDSGTNWPGEAGTLYSGNIYSYTFDAEYTEMVLTWKMNAQQQDVSQTENITLTGWSDATPYWNGSAWAALPDASLKDYYLIGVYGEHTTWTENLGNYTPFVIHDEIANEWKILGVTFEEGDEFKAVNKTMTNWYGKGDANIYVGEDEGKLAPGTYDIYFRPDGNVNEDWTGYFYFYQPNQNSGN